MNFFPFCTIITFLWSGENISATKQKLLSLSFGNEFLLEKREGREVFIRDKGIIYNDHLRTSDKVATTFPLNPSLTSKPVVSTGFIVADPSISFNNSRHKDYLVNRLSLPPLSTIDLSLSPSPRSIVYLEWPPRKVHLPESQYEGIAQDGSPRVHLHRRDNAIKRASLPLQSRGNDPFFFFSLPLPSLPLSFPLFLSFLFPSLLSLSLTHTPLAPSLSFFVVVVAQQ